VTRVEGRRIAKSVEMFLQGSRGDPAITLRELREVLQEVSPRRERKLLSWPLY